MGFKRALQAIGGAALAGALVIGVSPVAQADAARAAQWPLKQYGATQNLVWNHSTGKGITVAVVDSGVRATHVDLTGQVLPGKDFVFGGNGWTDHSPESHGTAVSSIIAGHGHGSNGGDGIMGLAPGAKILPIGIGTGADNSVQPQTVGEAIRYAVDHGAEVINLSIGGSTDDPTEEQAVAYAEQHNVVLVAAAGNDGGTFPVYPASYPGVVRVGAVDESATVWPQSDSGNITVMGAGVNIVVDTAASDTSLGQANGTSFATAYVSAIAALFRSAYPDLTAGQVINRIIKTAILPKGLVAPDAAYGYGVASPDFTTNVPAGPAVGPLPQASGAPSDSSSSSSAPVTTGSSSSSGSSSNGMAIGLGAVGGVVLLIVIGVVIARSRRRGGSGGGEPAYPTAPQYPNAPGQQQPYQPPTGQYGGQPQQQMPNNPYQQQGQPPHQQ
ncbi:type VII secretion-associated serine protease mycosin [Streptacidiphilus sp. BW17]|uniref:S8 family serine peptidase n=1 Tax=Streptacidiphilus sp. BW17 TaxID=3156274 RepID=UPI0035176BB3